MTVVYIDSLFLLNLILDYLLLLATARLTGGVVSRLRLLLGALLGAGYAVSLFLLPWGWLSHPAIRLCAGAVMALTAFGGQRGLPGRFLALLGLTFALAGGILAISLLGGSAIAYINQVPTTTLDWKVLLLSASGCYVLISLLTRRLSRRRSQQFRQLTLSLDGRQVQLCALVDTGHSLTDPISGQPAVVADWEAVRPLVPTLQAEDVLSPAEGLTRLSESWEPGRLRLLPYRAVGVTSGLLLALRPDNISLDGGGPEAPGLVALSPTSLSPDGTYSALISKQE